MNHQIIQSREELKEWLSIETKHYPSNFLKELLLVGENAVLKRHQILLRKAEYYTNTRKRIRSIFYRFRLSRFQCKYAMHIPLNSCGKGLRVMHVGPILMNGKVRLGENCSVHMNTSLVAKGTDDTAPVLGNGVVVGVGAVVLGGVYIADHIAIGASSVVNKSFEEPNIAIAGVPAKKISNNGSSKWGTGTTEKSEG